jgi:hypothetical protein
MSIDYAFRPRLRSRLTQSGRTCLWNPWGFGARDSYPSLRYSSRHSHFRLVHSCLPLLLLPTTERSPTSYHFPHSAYNLIHQGGFGAPVQGGNCFLLAPLLPCSHAPLLSNRGCMLNSGR